MNLQSFKDYLTPIGKYLRSKDGRNEVRDGIVIEPQIDIENLKNDDEEEVRLSSKEILDDIVDTLPHISQDDALKDRIMYEYVSPDGLDKKVFKESVTEIKRRHEVLPDEAAPRQFNRTSQLPTPAFVEEKAKATTLGTWMHEWMMLVIKYADDISSSDDKKSTLSKLFDDHGLSERINSSQKSQFINHALKFMTDASILSLLDHRLAIYTERPFIMNQRAIGEEVVPEQMVQGIIDLIIETDDAFTIIDYKTDYIDDKINEDMLILRYYKQIQLYKRSLEKLVGDKKPIHAYLYYFNWKGGAIKVDV